MMTGGGRPGRAGTGARPHAPVVGVLQAVVFVDLLGLTLVLPVLPFQTLQLGGNGLWLGVVLAGFSAAQTVAAPVLGRLADRYGRRRLLVLGLAGSAVSLAVMGLAGSLWLLLAARVVAGLCGGSIGVAHAFAADVTEPARRTQAMARLGMAVGAAFTIGPLLGALAAGAGFGVVAFLGAGLAVLALVAAWVLLPVSVPPPAGAGGATGRDTGSGARLLLAAAFAGMCALVGMEATVALLAEHRFAAGPGFVGVLLCVAGVAMTLVQARPLTGALRRWGDRPVAAGGAVAMAVGLLALPVSPVGAVMVGVAVVAAGQGLLSTRTNSLLSQLAEPARRGELLGRGQSAAAAGRLVGPLAAGALYDLGPGFPYSAGALLAASAAVAVGACAPRWAPGARMLGDPPGRTEGGT